VAGLGDEYATILNVSRRLAIVDASFSVAPKVMPLRDEDDLLKGVARGHFAAMPLLE